MRFAIRKIFPDILFPFRGDIICFAPGQTINGEDRRPWTPKNDHEPYTTDEETMATAKNENTPQQGNVSEDHLYIYLLISVFESKMTNLFSKLLSWDPVQKNLKMEQNQRGNGILQMKQK